MDLHKKLRRAILFIERALRVAVNVLDTISHLAPIHPVCRVQSHPN